MEHLPLSFVAGMLSILAPCVLPLLPVTLGGALTEAKDRYRPLLIILSLSVSIIVFTLLLKASTLLIMIDPRVWNFISGAIIFSFGIVTIFPGLWSRIETKLNLGSASGKLLQKSSKRQGRIGAVLIGAALGPVFTSCSPTYALIVAVILPQSFIVGLLNLLAYTFGLALVFGVIAIGGQRFLARIKWLANPNGTFKKLLGLLFVILGFAIMTGLEKKLESALLDVGLGNGVIQIENELKN